MHPKSKRSHFNIMVSSLVTSKGRCMKNSKFQWALSAWQALQLVRREQKPTLTSSVGKGLAAATEREAAKQSSWEYIHLLFPNQLLQWDYHDHDGLDHLIQLDGSSSGRVNKGSQDSDGLYWPGIAADAGGSFQHWSWPASQDWHC